MLVAFAAYATSVRQLSTEELGARADFIGIVRCVRAGGIVAGFEVEETWRGAPHPGDTLNLRTPPDYWGPQYPVTLVGTRKVVAAFVAAPAVMQATTPGSPVPLWWRNIPADYTLPLFQGAAVLTDGQPDLRKLGAGHGDLARLKAELLAAPRAPSSPPPPDPPNGAEAPPDEQQLAKWREKLAGPIASGWTAAFGALVFHDPDAVAARLRSFVRPNTDWSSADAGYILGSSLGASCRHCADALASLSDAADPWVRSAGAVYLALEDSERGIPALREAAKQPGAAGDWAGLALARRGDIQALDGILEALDRPATGAMEHMQDDLMRVRVLELLSNSAATSGVPAPPMAPGPLTVDKAAFDAWYGAHRSELRPTDPWLPILIAQRID